MLIAESIPWYANSAWAFIGVVAQILSLAAIIFAGYEIWKQRRRVRNVVWRVDLIGNADIRNLGKFHTLDVTNAGSGVADIRVMYFVNARPIGHEQARFKSILGSGEKFTTFLTAESIGNAWTLIIWSSQDDIGKVWAQWLPLHDDGSVGQVWSEDFEKWQSLSKWKRRKQRRRARPVGPGHAITSSFRAKSSESNTANLMTLMSGLPKGSHYNLSSVAPLVDFPLVEL